jgi:Domain of unknown function (DUF4383)
MGEEDEEPRDQASTSIDPGSEDVKRSRRVAREQAGWVKVAAALVGVAFLVAGVAGFVPGVTTNLDALMLSGHESGAELLGVFQVSILHNVVHLIFGVAGLALARSAASATHYLMFGGALYLVLWFYGLVVDQNGSGNFVPLNDADNWLHLGLGFAMLLLGLIGRRAGIAPGESVTD